MNESSCLCLCGLPLWSVLSFSPVLFLFCLCITLASRTRLRHMIGSLA